MIGLLVRLKLTLLRNSLSRSVWRTVGLVLGGLYGLFLVALVVWGLAALRLVPDRIAADATVVGFALLTAGWLLFSVLVFGVDETVDPARFALLPVRARDLQPGLLAAGLVTTPGLATVLIALGQVVTWTRGPVVVLAALIAAALGVATCFLLARTATSALARALGSRRFRDAALVVFTALAAGGGLAGGWLGSSVEERPDQFAVLFGRLAEVAAWTPFGWAWAVPGDVARGAWGTAVVHLVLASALVAALWLAWRAFLDRRLTEPIEPAGVGGRTRASAWVDRLYPATPAGGVAARTLRYWRRDPRYLAAVAAFLVVPVVIVGTSRLPGEASVGVVSAFAPALLGLLLGVSQAADLSYDGSAIWLHVASGVSGAADRAGRVMSSMTIFGPVLAVLVVVCVAATGDWSLLVPSLAATIGVTLVGMGVGSWVGTLWQWPAPPPGSNPFGKGSAGGLPSLLSFTVASGISLLVAAPILGMVAGSFWLSWLVWPAVLLAVVGGGAVLWLGIDRGGRLLDRRWPDVMTAVSERSA